MDNDRKREEDIEILSRQLQNPMAINWKDAKNDTNKKFTYLEYLEFSSAEEFERFRNTPISDEDIDEIDWDTLCGRFDKKSA